MNPFVDIQLSIQGLVVTVQYKVDPSFSGRAPYTYTLNAYQDETFTTPLYSLTSTTFFIVDNTQLRQNQLCSFLYTLSLTTADGKVFSSPFFGWSTSTSISGHKYLLASEISR